MTAEIYDKFKGANPRIKRYEREGSRVVIQCECALEQLETIKELEKNSTEDEFEIFLYSETSFWFKVKTVDKGFTDNLVRDFISKK